MYQDLGGSVGLRFVRTTEEPHETLRRDFRDQVESVSFISEAVVVGVDQHSSYRCVVSLHVSSHVLF